jgi:hypothetical protein
MIPIASLSGDPAESMEPRDESAFEVIHELSRQLVGLNELLSQRHPVR